MNREGATERAERLRAELFKELGYSVGKHDPLIALAYTLRELQLDLHDTLLDGLGRVEGTTKELIGQSRAEVREGVSLADDASRTLSELQHLIDGMTDSAAQIAAATEQQASRVDGVNGLLGDVQQVTREYASLASSTLETAELVSRHVETQDKLLGVFVTDDGEQEPGEAEDAA